MTPPYELELFQITSVLKHQGEIKILNDIIKMFIKSENKLIDAKKEIDKRENICRAEKYYEVRILQYWNLWEWFATLLKTKYVDEFNPLVEIYFKPTFINDYKHFIIEDDNKTHKMLKDLVNDVNTTDLKSIKWLNEKWNYNDNDNKSL